MPFTLTSTVVVPRQVDPLVEVQEDVQGAPHEAYSKRMLPMSFNSATGGGAFCRLYTPPPFAIDPLSSVHLE